jgi:hypothetical protein
MEPFPIRHSSSSVQPWITQAWPTVTPGPISTGSAALTWTTEQSWTLAPARMTIGAVSPRTTALYQMDALASTMTSPMTTAVGAMNAPGSTRGDLSSKRKSGMGMASEVG